MSDEFRIRKYHEYICIEATALKDRFDEENPRIEFFKSSFVA